MCTLLFRNSLTADLFLLLSLPTRCPIYQSGNFCRSGSAGQLAASADEAGSELRKRPAGKEEAKAPEAAAKTSEAQGDGDRCPISGKQGRLEMPRCGFESRESSLDFSDGHHLGDRRGGIYNAAMCHVAVGLEDCCIGRMWWNGAIALLPGLHSKVLAPWPQSWASRNLRKRHRPTSRPQLPVLVELLWLERAS